MKTPPDSLAHTLRENRPSCLAQPSDAFLGRVMSEVRLTGQEKPEFFAPSQAWWLAAAAALALVFAGHHLTRTRQHATIPSATIAEVNEVLQWSPAQTLAAYDPVAREMTALKNDGKNALEFLRKQTEVVTAGW